MSERVVLITGALTGIGRATALAFAHEGSHVVVSGRRDDAGHALAAELSKLGTEAEYVRVDARHDDEVRNLVDQAVARFQPITNPARLLSRGIAHILGGRVGATVLTASPFSPESCHRISACSAHSR